MFQRSAKSGTRPLKSTALLLALAVLMPLASTQESVGAADGPFAGLSGSWSGSGKILTSNGSNERVRCRASYAVASGGNNLQQSLRCASDSYKFEIQSDVNNRAGSLSGAWREVNRSLTGQLSGSIKPGELKTRIDSPGFGADISVLTTGERQQVRLNSQSTELTGVSITFTKR